MAMCVALRPSAKEWRGAKVALEKTLDHVGCAIAGGDASSTMVATAASAATAAAASDGAERPAPSRRRSRGASAIPEAGALVKGCSVRSAGDARGREKSGGTDDDVSEGQRGASVWCAWARWHD